MANLTTVGITSGVPSSGTGTVSTIDNLIAVGSPINNGSSSVLVAITGASSAPTSSMSALVVGLSPNSVNANGQATMANSAPVVIASNQSAITTTLSSNPTLNAKNFLWQVSAASSALLVSAVTVMSSELVSLASSGGVVGANTYGSSNTAQAIWADIYLTFGTTATTASGANCAGWFANSLDGGTTFESTAQVTTTSGLARPPDFTIPVPVGTLGSSLTYKAAGLVKLPPGQWKPILQNNLGIATGSSSNSGFPLLRMAPYAEQY